ncbi:MAG TPA: hybrid sensor histidine kinase/response regulator [Aggregatilinea sp.]|uniref:hybrid sensor histidine kinase/response regulator n=1 Tax=Aggregatilinea sp. TaxID=2806333 RepID=UPI002BEDA574|nr:hybrid sensor histidine kinase/response regulator [Aggregatilinea sp.]HML21638.1 hybrid sensor histidine kinase/response regulator [Aggregatilinea sp.]
MTAIVVIDDDPLGRERVVTTLRYQGYQAASACDGTGGIQLVRDLTPDLVLCDINMPDMDGYSVLKQLRSNACTADIPLVFLTGCADRDDMRRGMELGADDYLTKPFTNNELVASVQTQLEKRRAITEKYESTIKLLRKNIIYALPHELRTPITGCLGYAELLREDAETCTPDDVRLMASHIVTNTLRLHHVLENFLVYAQIEVLAADAAQLAHLRNHITGHIGQVVEARAWEIADKHRRRADLAINVQDFAAQIAEQDLSKIITELVDNAFKFSRPNMPVSVRVWHDHKSFHIEVADQGRGMSPEQITSVGAYMQFDRVLFEQQGLGLGLIIAKRLVEIHGGHFAIQSDPEKGTRVRLSFELYH